jgi:hypothetical protein
MPKKPNEPYKVYGEVKRHEKRTITKKVSEGIGENATTRIVEEEVRLQKDRPFDSIVGSNVILTMKESQSKLGDHGEE